MTDNALVDWPKWRDALILDLRLRDVPGDRIGDIVLEVESHLRETGESPEAAFGEPKTYAVTRAASLPGTTRPGEMNAKDLSLIALFFAGGLLYAGGAWSLGIRQDSYFGLNAWIALLTGTAILLIGPLRLSSDLVRHPVTHAPILGGSRFRKWLPAGVIVVVGIALYTTGRLAA